MNEVYVPCTIHLIGIIARLLAEALLLESFYIDIEDPTDADEQQHCLSLEIIDRCEEFFGSRAFRETTDLDSEKVLTAIYQFYGSKTFRNNIEDFVKVRKRQRNPVS